MVKLSSSSNDGQIFDLSLMDIEKNPKTLSMKPSNASAAITSIDSFTESCSDSTRSDDADEITPINTTHYNAKSPPRRSIFPTKCWKPNPSQPARITTATTTRVARSPSKHDRHESNLSKALAAASAADAQIDQESKQDEQQVDADEADRHNDCDFVTPLLSRQLSASLPSRRSFMPSYRSRSLSSSSFPNESLDESRSGRMPRKSQSSPQLEDEQSHNGSLPHASCLRETRFSGTRRRSSSMSEYSASSSVRFDTEVQVVHFEPPKEIYAPSGWSDYFVG